MFVVCRQQGRGFWGRGRVVRAHVSTYAHVCALDLAGLFVSDLCDHHSGMIVPFLSRELWCMVSVSRDHR